MAKLHELLAAEKTPTGAWNQLFEDTLKKFKSTANFFEGHSKFLRMLEETPENTAIVRAEGQRDQLTLVADGKLAEAQRNAEGIRAEGSAKADAEQALQLASVIAQTTLAEKIGDNPGYQSYLVTAQAVEAQLAIGVAQAEALKSADIKVIATGDRVDDGMKTASEILSPKTGTRIGGMIDAFANTETGKMLMTFVQGKAREG